MLTLLKIRNLALVDELVWELGSGLISVTGETGAGKSVIVGALKMILGERADKGLIRTGEETCTIESVFDLADSTEINAILEEGGLNPCEDTQIIIRRAIGTTANRQFINDSPVTLNLLRKVGERLVDLHGPHDHQSLLSQERQLGMLDAYAGNEPQLQKYRVSYREWRENHHALEDLRNATDASDQELDLLRFQLEEITDADLTDKDGEPLQERYHRSSNSSRLLELAAHAVSALADEDGIMSRISDLQRFARDLEKFDPTLSDRLSSLETASIELQDLEATLTDYAEDLDIDPNEANSIEARVNLVESLKRKYGPEIEDVLARREMITDRLDNMDNRSEKMETLTAALVESRKKLDAAARKLTTIRKKAAPKLAKEIADQLKELGFKQSSFEVELSTLEEPSLSGIETCNFQFGPNPGEPLLPLRQIASSGEISRVMLAVKSSLAEQDATPLMVFDEIDANVGGEIARAVGKKMSLLGELHQVIAITHFPQVAATASAHFVVEKEIVAGRTRSKLYPVEGEKRISELVRMLGGGGQQARDMAASLLET
ncbi:MAG: DNA repair protein RecN [Akkermansiaceae bacterium]